MGGDIAVNRFTQDLPVDRGVEPVNPEYDHLRDQ